MSSLADCLNKMGKVFSPEERATIFEARKAQIATGLDVQAAELAAVMNIYADAQAEHKTVSDAITRAIELSELPVYASKQEAMLAAVKETKARRVRFRAEQHPEETGKWTITQTVRSDAQQSAAAKTAIRQRAARRPDESRDSITTYIAKLGGIRLDEAPDLTGERKPLRAPRAPMLFLIRKQGGMGIDQLGELLTDAGYFTERPDEQEIRDKIVAELDGVDQYSVWGTEAQASAADQKMREAEEAAAYFAEQAGIDDLEQVSTVEQVAAIRDFVPAQESEITGPRLALAELSLKAEQLDEGAVERLAIQSEGMSDEDYARALQEIIDANVKDVESRDSGVGEAVEPFALAGETEVERQARESGERARAEREREEAERDDARARADREREDFGLTGSERAADANPNQTGMFQVSDGLTPTAQAAWPEILRRIGELAHAITPNTKVYGIQAETFPNYLEIDDAGTASVGFYEGSPVAGSYHPIKNIIAVALGTYDPIRTFRHEAIHALKGMGLFDAQEWKSLESQSKKEWRRKYDVENRWAQFGMTDTQLTEEGIAEAYSDFKAGALNAKPPVQKIMRKIAEFLQRLGNLLRGMGFQTVDDIFAKVESGEVGRRLPGSEAGSGDVSYAVAPPPSGNRYIASASRRLRQQNPSPSVWISDLGSLENSMVKPRTVAAFYRDAVPAYTTLVDEIKARDQKFAEYTKAAEPYFLGTKADRDAVNKVLEHDRLTGQYALAGQNMTVHFTSPKAQLSQPGERLTVTGDQKTMYWAARNMLNMAFNDFKAVILEDFGLHGNLTSQQVRDLAQQASFGAGRGQPLTPAQRAMHTRRVNELAALADSLEVLEDAYRRGYVPFSRFGNVGIVVKNAKGEVAEYATLDLGPLDKRRGKAGLARVPEVREKLEELRRNGQAGKYGAGYTIGQPFKVPAGGLAKEVKLQDVDVLAEIGKVDEQQWAEVREALAKGKTAQGFGARFIRSRDIPGYSIDFERVLAHYINQAATFYARRSFAGRWESAINYIDNGTQPELRKYFSDLADYVHNPEEEFQTYRSAAFFMYLTSVASALVNLSQTVVVGLPVLTQVAGTVRVSSALLRAEVDAARMLSVDATTKLQFFDPAKAPADVRAAVQKAWDEGEFVNVVTKEYMGLAKNRHPVLKKLTPKAQFVVELAASFFTLAEMQNRLTIFIAAHRLARDVPEVRTNFAAVTAGNALANQVSENWSPEAFADFMNKEINFEMGKVNRARLERGVGTVVFQFMGFVWNMLERQATMAMLHGTAGRAAVLFMAGILWAVAGFWGIPGMERLRQLIEFINRKAFKTDIDLDLELRKFVTEVTGNTMLAKMMAAGVSRGAGGPDLSRIGMGQLFNTPAIVDFAGKIPDAFEQAELGNWQLALAEVAPPILAGPLTAAAWAKQGVRTTTTDAPLIPPSKVTAGDLAQKSIGFTPGDFSEVRARERAERRIEHTVDEMRRIFYRRFAKAEFAHGEAKKQGDFADEQFWQAEIDKLNAEVKQWNAVHEKASERIKLDSKTMNENLKREQQGADRQKGKRRQARQEIFEIQDYYGGTNR